MFEDCKCIFEEKNTLNIQFNKGNFDKELIKLAINKLEEEITNSRIWKLVQNKRVNGV